MSENDIFRQRVRDFFESYIQFPKSAYSNDKYLTYDDICAAIALLLKEGIFSTEQEIKLDAVKNFGVILPDCYFAKAKEVLEFMGKEK